MAALPKFSFDVAEACKQLGLGTFQPHSSFERPSPSSHRHEVNGLDQARLGGIISVETDRGRYHLRDASRRTNLPSEQSENVGLDRFVELQKMQGGLEALLHSTGVVLPRPVANNGICVAVIDALP